MKITCIAVDDEPLALELIEEYIKKIPHLYLVRTFNNALDTLEFLKDNKIDLILLDIQMDDLTGVQLVKVLRNKPMVIFTTAYDKYAIEGYDLEITDYLLKPISFERFLKAINKVYDRLNEQSANKPDINRIVMQNDDEKYFFVKSDSKLIKINYDDVLFIEGQRDYLMIHTIMGNIMTLLNFKSMECILKGKKFCRVHKSFIVSIDKIIRIEHNTIKIEDKSIPISKSYQSAFFNMIKK